MGILDRFKKDDFSLTDVKEPDRNQSEVKSKMSLTQFALVIIVVGATFFVANYANPIGFNGEDWFPIGFIIMIIGGIVAAVGRSRKKETNEPKNRKKIAHPALLIFLAGATLFVEFIIWSIVIDYFWYDIEIFHEGIILMIIGGIVAGITRLQRKKQYLK